MINNANEFIQLRQSEDPNEQHRATHEEADMKVWLDVIQEFPDFKKWVIHNKTIPLEILALLAKDKDPNIRSEVARKRKIDDDVFLLLSNDEDENVRYALMWNTKLPLHKKREIKMDDSPWLQQQFADMVKKSET